MKKMKLIALLVVCQLAIQAQVQWPAITQTTKPWTRWWWQGSAVNKPDLAAAMKKYQLAGLGGLEITPIYGVKGYESQFIEYLSPRWVEMLQFTLQEAKRLGMGVDMATGTGWPFGGPWVTPADACKNINLVNYTVKGGEQLQEPIQFTQQPLVRTESDQKPDIKTLSYPIATNKNLQLYAFDQVRFEKQLPLQLLMAYPDTGTPLDLTARVDSTGRLNWTAPAGSSWTLYALFQGWHGKMVERAAPGGEGDAIDHFSAAALKNYLSQFDKAFSGKDISYLRSFFNDSYEVDDARGQSNWTPDFIQQFKQRRGYDLRNELPALYQKDNAEKSSRVLYDYRQTISELLLEKFTTPWHQWAKDKGKLIRNQSHGSPANILDLYGAIDIPETEGTDILRFKFATSTAHVMGKPLASSESATWLDEHFQSSLGDVKQIIDKYFVGGVNHIFYHGTNYSPQNEQWPGWLFYAAVHFTPANSFWKDFPALNHYVTRCQSFLQAGKPNNDILLYFPFSDKISEPGNEMLHHFDGMKGFEKTIFNSGATYLLQKGYAFDLISDKQIQQLKSINKLLETGGIRYQTILLAATKFLPLETMQQLIHLAEQGATIIVYKGMPADVPGFADLSARQSSFKKLLSKLHFNKEAGIEKAITGQGQFLMGDDLPALLLAAAVRREPMVDNNLEYVRRQYAGGNYYFISNAGNQAFSGDVALQAEASTAILFDPMLERKGLAKVHPAQDGKLAVFLNLQPGESIIVQTTHTKITGSLFPYTTTTGDAQAIIGEWKINFVNGGPTLPAAATVKTLGSWTDLPNEEVKKFSGTAQYSIRFRKPAGKAAAWILDLGALGESAEVLLNGAKLAVLLGPSFQLTIPAARFRDDNLLQVNVTNGMANRIADLDKRGVQWKKFYNTNFPARLAKNRGADGLFTAAKWAPKPSGLMGPVSLTPVIFVH
ncbi:MAG: glycosyl hydrolase [Chitinophagaceae bacterium]